MESTERLHAIQDLMEEILQIQKENTKDTADIERIQQIVQQSNKLVEKSELINELLVDARILHTGSVVVNSNVLSVDTNLTSFDEDEMQKGITTYIKDNAAGEVTEKSWRCLAPVTYHLFAKSHPPSFMLGSLSFDPEPILERVTSERNKRVLKSKQKLCLSEDPCNVRKETEESGYDHILKSLVKYYKKNGKRPVLFLNFIIDPGSYWNSVKNIFYFSFLVRDGLVNMFLNDEGLPVIEPIVKSDPNEVESIKSGCQFIFSLSQEEWRNCITRFNIFHAQINSS